MATRLWTAALWGHGAAPGRAERAPRGRVAGLAGVLWRRWLPMLGCVLVALGLAAAYVGGRAPLYRATVLVALDRAASEPGARMQDGDLQDQLRRIESRPIAEQLVKRLDLHFVPEFQPELRWGQGRKDPWLPSPFLQWLPEPFAQTLGAGAAEGEITDEQRALRWRNAAIATAMFQIEAEVVRPGVLGLQFASADPHLAAAAANALAELYLEGQRPPPGDVPEERTRIAAEIERLRARIRETEQAIKAARASAQAGIAPAGEGSLRELTGELAIWRRERIEAEVRLRLAEAALASGAALERGMPDSARERLDSLRAREAEIERALAALSAQHGEDDAQVAQLRTELQALQNERRAEIQLIVSRLQREIEIIRSREAALAAEIKGVGGRDARDEPAAGADPLRSEQKLKGERAQLQERLVQLEAQAAGSLRSARIIEPAIAPDRPVRPRTAMIYGVALAGGALLGGLVAFALERVRRARA